MQINWYGDILTDKYYILPDKDHSMPIIKTPCYLKDADEIDLTFSTQEDAKVIECPECKCDVISATLSPSQMDVAHWHCLRGHSWNTPRGIFFQLSFLNLLAPVQK